MKRYKITIETPTETFFEEKEAESKIEAIKLAIKKKKDILQVRAEISKPKVLGLENLY